MRPIVKQLDSSSTSVYKAINYPSQVSHPFVRAREWNSALCCAVPLTTDVAQNVMFQVPNGMNGLPPTFLLTSTSIVFFGPIPTVGLRTNASSR